MGRLDWSTPADSSQKQWQEGASRLSRLLAVAIMTSNHSQVLIRVSGCVSINFGASDKRIDGLLIRSRGDQVEGVTEESPRPWSPSPPRRRSPPPMRRRPKKDAAVVVRTPTYPPPRAAAAVGVLCAAGTVCLPPAAHCPGYEARPHSPPAS